MAVLSVQKSLDIIEAVADYQEGIGTRALAKKLGINVTTVYNVANTLKQHGYLEQDPVTKRYRPGLRLMVLGRHHSFLETLADLARPFVRRMARELDESVMLTTLDRGRVMILEFVPSSQPLRVQEPSELGAGAYSTACGKIMLAAMSPASLTSYLEEYPPPRLTPATLATKREVLAEIERIRQRGYAATEGEACEGVSALAVGLANPWGKVIAALGASAPTIRFGKARRHQTLVTLQRVAGEIAHAWFREGERQPRMAKECDGG